jgi:hypothetical protein
MLNPLASNLIDKFWLAKGIGCFGWLGTIDDSTVLLLK